MIERVELDPRIRVRNNAKLLSGPVVIRVTEFHDQATVEFAEAMNFAAQCGQSVIPIVIDSYGGDAYSLFSMIDILKTATVPIATIVEGKAMSCGAALFTCGAAGLRFMGPNATLMLHDVSLTASEGKSEEIKVDAKETDRLNRKMWQLMERNIGKPKNYLWKMVQERGRTDWYMTAQEAVRHNIANVVKIPTLVTTVSVATVLE